jgi:hypothetical protein
MAVGCGGRALRLDFQGAANFCDIRCSVELALSGARSQQISRLEVVILELVILDEPLSIDARPIYCYLVIYVLFPPASR